MSACEGFEKVLFIMILVMLSAVILGYVVLGNSGVLIYLYAVAFAVQVVILAVTIFRKKLKVDKRIFLLTGIYIVISLAPCITNTFMGIETATNDYLNIIFKCFYFFALFGIMSTVRITNEQFKRFMKYIIIVGVVACLYNFIFDYNEIMKIFTSTSSYQVNVQSFFTSRNSYGGFLVLALIATYYMYSEPKSKKEKRNKILLISLFVINILMTFSRGSIFPTILLILFMLYDKYKNKKSILIVGILFFILCIVALSNTALMEFIEKFIIRSDNFDTGRFELWKYGFEVIKMNPIVGFGYYTGADVALSANSVNSQFHNFFIETIVGCGIVGLIFICSILIHTYRKCMKHCEYDNYKKICTISYITMFMKMCIESVSFFSIGYSDNITTIFYITVPLLLSNMRKEEKVNE